MRTDIRFSFIWSESQIPRISVHWEMKTDQTRICLFALWAIRRQARMVISSDSSVLHWKVRDNCRSLRRRLRSNTWKGLLVQRSRSLPCSSYIRTECVSRLSDVPIYVKSSSCRATAGCWLWRSECDEVWEFVPQTFRMAGGVEHDGIQQSAFRFTTYARVVLLLPCFFANFGSSLILVLRWSHSFFKRPSFSLFHKPLPRLRSVRVENCTSEPSTCNVIQVLERQFE